MKILSQPNVDNWCINHTCSECEAKLEVDSNDIKVTHYEGDYRDPPYDSYSANCAVCGYHFAISADKIPKLIKTKLKAKRSY